MFNSICICLFVILITENLVEDMLGDFEYEVQPPYLLYRNATQEVNGIWFYNQADCEAVANLFGRYCRNSHILNSAVSQNCILFHIIISLAYFS